MEINHTYDQDDLQVCLKPTTGHQPSLLISLAYTLQTASCHFAFCLSSNLTMHISKYQMFRFNIALVESMEFGAANATFGCDTYSYGRCPCP